MKIKQFIITIISNILQIEFLLKPAYTSNHISTKQHDSNDSDVQQQQQTAVTLEWILDHMGSRGNYPNYKFDNNSPLNLQDNITAEYNIEQIQLIIRHGTVYPVRNRMIAINGALQKLNESRNDDLIGWWKTYKNEYLYRRTSQLDLNGQHEQYLIGRRLARNYPEFIDSLIDGDIISTQFEASTSWSDRTSQSGQAFCIGLFEGLGSLGPANLMSVPIFSLTQNNDSLIAFHKACPKWQEYSKNMINAVLDPVKDKYLKPIAARISADLDIDVTPADVIAFQQGCTSEVSLYHTVHTFCKLFTQEDTIKMEYIDDLYHYYKYSYVLPDLNDDMACDLGKYIMSSIESRLLQDKNAIKLDIKFGHSETLLPLRTLLGLNRDKIKFSPNSTKEEIENRQYKLSKFGFFANNVAFQLLSHKLDHRKFVRVLDNEVPIILPGCKKTTCPIDQFRAYMKPRIQCNFIDFCKI